MINLSRFMMILLQFFYSCIFSFCTFTAMKQLFYRKVKNFVIFSISSGAIMGIATLIQIILSEGEINISPVLGIFYLLHTFIGWRLITAGDKDSLFSLIMAEIFSAGIMNNMQTALFSLTYNSSESFLMINAMYLLSYFVSALFIFLLGLLVKSGEREPMSRLNIFLLTSIMLITALLISDRYTLSDYIPDVSSDAILPIIFILMTVTALFLLSVKSTQLKHFEELNTLNEQYITAQARHFEQTRAADEKMRLLRHDMKNHISTLTMLYNSGKMNELKNYLENINSEINDTQTVTYTGNEIADAVLTDKKALAKSYGAEIIVDGSLSGLAAPSVSLCTILANLLDNSIKAVKDLPENRRNIFFTSKRTGNFFYISIKNNTADFVDVSQEIISRNKEVENHGLGLRSVKKAVNTCDGALELNCDKTADGYEFTAEVTLPVKKKI